MYGELGVNCKMGRNRVSTWVMYSRFCFCNFWINYLFPVGGSPIRSVKAAINKTSNGLSRRCNFQL